MYRLIMIRGKRQVLIGFFPNRNRAETISVILEWDGSWKPKIDIVKIKDLILVPE